MRPPTGPSSRRRAPSARALGFVWLLGAVPGGCANGYPAATCQACDGRTFTSSDCARFASVAGCATSSVGTPEAGCSGRCTFSDCAGIPLCTGLAPRDAGAATDVR